MARIFEGGYKWEKGKPQEPTAMIKPEVAKGRFLELYMHTAHIGRTCQILGLVPRTVYHWKNDDKQFAEDLIMADRVALSLLEDEATRRAMYGVEKPVYQGGKLAGYVTEYSDQLLIVLLKARDPQRYREQWKGELTGADGKPLMGDTKIVHVHSNLPLSSSEDQVLLDDANTIRIESGTVDAEPISVTTTPAQDKAIDDLL